MKAVYWIILALLVGGGVFLVVQSEKRQAQRDASISPTASVQPPFSQSGEVTEVSSTALTIRYPTTVNVNGVDSSVYHQKTVSIMETTPVSRLVKNGEGFQEVQAKISDIAVHMNVSILLPQQEGPALFAMKVFILGTSSQ